MTKKKHSTTELKWQRYKLLYVNVGPSTMRNTDTTDYDIKKNQIWKMLNNLKIKEHQMA